MAGLVATIVVADLTTKLIAGSTVNPIVNVTAVAFVRFLPVIVTAVSPANDPAAGAILVIAGAAT